jgi:hypothetical protein
MVHLQFLVLHVQNRRDRLANVLVLQQYLIRCPRTLDRGTPRFSALGIAT